MTEPIVVATSASLDEFRQAIRSGRAVVVVDELAKPTDRVIDTLVRAAAGSGVGSASPVPIATALRSTSYDLHPASPPAPTLALPCRQLCVLSAEALASLPTVPDGGDSVAAQLVVVAERLLQHGWRHVAAPGSALKWDPSDSTGTNPTAGWDQTTIANMIGPANVGLEAHTSWAGACTTGLRVVVDGACITDDPFTGTQHLVIEITRWLAAVRPEAKVMLATQRSVISASRSQLAGTGVEVVARRNDLQADVVYRPYQMLYAKELSFVLAVGRRGLVGQLDMIGYSNPFYHPSPALFFFARNLQRHLMRTLDGVTFISAFGRDSALAECPDLVPERLHVVSCGADPAPQEGALAPGRLLDQDSRFIACLSSTFWHKNRAHAIATFERLVEEYAYDGHLVIGGPEPFYGRSTDAEDDLLSRLEPDLRARIHRWGHVPDAEKWWLLRHADAVLYPSVVEGFGLVPFESAAVGTPCLTFAGTAPGELLRGTAATVATWNTAEWARRAAELIQQPGAASTLVAEIATAASGHTWQRAAERTWSAIDHALAIPSRTRHADDGGLLTRIAPTGRRLGRAASLRFDLVRAAPALARRIRRTRTAQERTR